MRCLIVVDYQMDKVAGKLENSIAKEIEWSIVSKIRDYIGNEHEVYYTTDEHPVDYKSCNESKIIQTPHCLKGTEGAELYGEVRIYLKELCNACSKSSFGSTSLIRKLRGQENKLIEATRIGIKHVEIVGCQLEYDIMATAIMCKAALPEADIIVNRELCSYVDETKSKIALVAMRNVGIQII